MNFERVLTEEEIVGALQKGTAKADFILARATEDPSHLAGMYENMLKVVDHAEDNFSLEGYANKDKIYEAKGTPPLTEKDLRRMFLCAVNAVECLEEIEPRIKESERKRILQKIEDEREIARQKEQGDDYEGPRSKDEQDRHGMLLRAATVFRTDGKKNYKAGDVEKIIQSYRGTFPNIAAQ